MVVIKRDGREVNFDKAKIRDAAYRALCEVDHLHPIENKENLAERVANRLALKYKNLRRAISVEEIQDDVENRLMEEGVYEVAKAYIKYRYEHELLRNMSTLDGKVLSIADNVNETVIQENSNKNPSILSTQRDYIAGELSRDITNRLLLPEEIAKAHEEGIIHFHDSDYYVQHMHNCFSSGTRFVTRDGVIAFSDCHDGQKVVVLDKDGQWRDAVVHQYDEQKLYDVTIRSTKSEKTIVCTRDHRWILKDGEVTTNLSVGDCLYALKDSTTNRQEMSRRDAEMFALGFVIGDGSDLPKGLQVRLCGHKSEYSNVFTQADYRCYKVDGRDPGFTKACDLSKQDFLDKSVWKYLSGQDKEMLFRGLYAPVSSKIGRAHV